MTDELCRYHELETNYESYRCHERKTNESRVRERDIYMTGGSCRYHELETDDESCTYHCRVREREIST